MGCFKNGLLIEFSVTSFLIMAALAVVISLVLTNRLDRNVDLLEIHGATMMAHQTIHGNRQVWVISDAVPSTLINDIAKVSPSKGFVMLSSGAAA